MAHSSLSSRLTPTHCRALGICKVPQLHGRSADVVGHLAGERSAMQPWSQAVRHAEALTLNASSVQMCIAVLRLGYWATVASPLFVMVLTLAVSGVPLQVRVAACCCHTATRNAAGAAVSQPVLLQEKQQKERWGKDPAYQAWRERTNLLVPVPNPWRKSRASPSLRQSLQSDSDQTNA